MVAPYLSDPATVVVPRAVPLGSIWVTQHPLEDPDPGPGLAHLNYAQALEIAAANGARLPTTEEILALHEAAAAACTELSPLFLPDATLRAEGCVPGDARMVTRPWCDRHDSGVLAAIAALGDRGDAPIANAGKHWRGGAPPNLAGLCGWWVPDVSLFGSSRRGPGFIQAGADWPHNREHADYGTTTVLVWDCDPSAPAAG